MNANKASTTVGFSLEREKRERDRILVLMKNRNICADLLVRLEGISMGRMIQNLKCQINKAN